MRPFYKVGRSPKSVFPFFRFSGFLASVVLASWHAFQSHGKTRKPENRKTGKTEKQKNGKTDLRAQQTLQEGRNRVPLITEDTAWELYINVVVAP